ncbi:MAG: FecR domain-containing protein [Alphaproteobacteria bacterium]|nr:FecR domain-containing protein [Alphaproteobacteria bacterium]
MTGSDAKDDPIREEAIDWLLKAESAPDDRAVQAALAAWRARREAHERAYRSVARMWRLAGDLPLDAAIQGRGGSPSQFRAAAAGRGRAAGRTAKAKQRTVARRRLTAGGIAAALVACLLIFAGPSVWLQLRADHVTGVAETRAIQLDDGSTVFLAAESAVAIDFAPSQRTIRLLAGQAYFDVAHDAKRPFMVAADRFVVEVTGTAFAVGRTCEDVSVIVESGSVAVALDGGDAPEVRLKPGDRLAVATTTGNVTRSRVPLTRVAAWRTGQLVVDGVPLADVVEALDRYHRGVIWLPDAGLGARRITGVFSLTDPVAALEAAAGTQNARVMAVTPFLLVVQPR